MNRVSEISVCAILCAALVVLLTLNASCGRAAKQPLGFSDFEQALRAADAAILRGDARDARRAVDLTGVPEKIASLLRQGDGSLQPSSEYRFIERKVLSAEEHRVFEAKFRESLPAYFRDRPSHAKWNITPERWIVYRFDPVRPSEMQSPLVFTIGVFQRASIWYFAVDYYPFESAL